MTTSFRSGRTRVLQLAHDGERDVALQMALVELVEHDDADVLEEGIARELAAEDALGEEPEPRRGAAARARSGRGSRPRRRRAPPRSRATNSAAARAAIRRGSSTTTVPVAGEAGVEQRGGHARRLARAGRGAQHEAVAAARARRRRQGGADRSGSGAAGLAARERRLG